MATAQWEYRQEQAKVAAITAAAEAPQRHAIEPGHELDVLALLKAARAELN